MHILILFTLAATTTFTYWISKGWLPSIFRYTPEVLAVLAVIYVVAVGIQAKFRFVNPIYWLIFGGLIIGIVCSALANQLAPGPMLAGLRTFFRALPFFLLPAVFLVTEKRLRTQLLLLLGICLLQVPIAIQQRLDTTEVGRLRGYYIATGDWTVGTIMNSGMLSIFLISAACVLTALFVRRQLSGKSYLFLLALVLLPTTINETKITFILVPIALLITYYVGSSPGKRLRNTFLGMAVALGFLAAFVPIYDYYQSPRWGYSIVDFFLMEGRVEGYLFKGAELGDEKGSRFDGMRLAILELMKDPPRLLFGLGIGNASESALGHQFSGAHYKLFENFSINAFSLILLELGVFGLALILLAHYRIAKDSMEVAKMDNGLAGALAVGWVGVSVAMLATFIYSDPINNSALSYPFWYFSGFIAAYRWRYMRVHARRPSAPPSASSEVPAQGTS